jgi:hypothetical protein
MWWAVKDSVWCPVNVSLIAAAAAYKQASAFRPA